MQRHFKILGSHHACSQGFTTGLPASNAKQAKEGSLPVMIFTNLKIRFFLGTHPRSQGLKAGFPLGEFVRANKQKANVIGW